MPDSGDLPAGHERGRRRLRGTVYEWRDGRFSTLPSPSVACVGALVDAVDVGGASSSTGDCRDMSIATALVGADVETTSSDAGGACWRPASND